LSRRPSHDRSWTARAFCGKPAGPPLRRAAILPVLAGMLAGCQSQPAALPPPRPINQVTYSSPTGSPLDAPASAAPGVGPMSADQIVNSDATAVRLQDVEGVLLQFYALYRRMPNSLDEARPLADADAPADLFFSPVTHAPFAYTAAGLGSGKNPKRIILYESVPQPGGQRWCILMPPPSASHTGSVTMEVIALPDSVFRQFTPQR
jgi:hypothetical protein